MPLYPVISGYRLESQANLFICCAIHRDSRRTGLPACLVMSTDKTWFGGFKRGGGEYMFVWTEQFDNDDTSSGFFTLSISELEILEIHMEINFEAYLGFPSLFLLFGLFYLSFQKPLPTGSPELPFYKCLCHN